MAVIELKNLTFRDIMERDLIYFDSGALAECRHFCQLLKISYLPNLLKPMSYYELDGEYFKGPNQLQPEQYVHADELIFQDKDLLEKFQASPHNVIFVVDHQHIVGVVHICDYNKPVVLMNYYAYLLDFEHKLRDLIFLRGLRNEDMIVYLRQILPQASASNKRRIELDIERASKRTEQEDASTPGHLQGFSIHDLIHFARSKNLLDIEKDDINDLRELRNSIMHGLDVVERSGELFSFESLELHFRRIFTFVKCYRKLRVKLRKAVEENIRLSNRLRLQSLKDFDPALLNGSRLMWKYLDL
ncbi:MAG: hypothetical protein SF053_22105 [Bacteroidia bacterium]|nr:hypothetical protein [Bacteroidia bacterium]